MKNTSRKRFQRQAVVLLILDGWGIAKGKKGNAIANAKTPNLDFLSKRYPHAILRAAGEAVGLPPGNQGTSEVGHLNIGAGRIVDQSLVRINKSLKDKSFFRIKGLVSAIDHCKKYRRTLHLMGLLQDQGVHASQEHLFALMRLCKMRRFKDVAIHVFSDGRDTLPKSCMRYISALKRQIRKLGLGNIATLSGRYYSMDRDKRWHRTRKAYECIANGKGLRAKSIDSAVSQAYGRDETDEFILPTAIGSYEGLKNNDAVIFYNFRYDRARQITMAMVEPGFAGFKRKMKEIFFVGMTDYYKGMRARIAFQPLKLKNTLGEVISRHGMKQLRVAETEKYAHVTYFFNGLQEKPNRGEDRILIPSLKVATYDLAPRMRAYEIAKKVIEKLDTTKYGLIVANFANGDMVGHTGVFKAGIQACEHVDKCIGSVYRAAQSAGAALIITADHGNCEKMKEKNGSPNTAHTTSQVPFILAASGNYQLRNGILSDIAPTILRLLSIKKPKEMDRKGLIVNI